MNKLLMIGLTLVLSACGGGGGGDPDSDQYWQDDSADGAGRVSITPPDQDLKGNRGAFTRTPSGAFETERTHATFNGGVSFLNDAVCGGDTGFTVTVTNAATGETKNAADRVNCPLIFRIGIWQAASIQLAPGSNRITANGAGDTDSITVIRIVDLEPPRVTSVSPEDGSIDVPVSGVELQVNFSEPMTVSSIDSTSFFVEDSTGAAVPGTVSYFRPGQFESQLNRVTFTADGWLNYGTIYTARLTTAVMDDHGNALADEYSWSFTTVLDIIPPTKVAESPVAGDVCVPPDRDIAVRFDKLLDPATVTAATFTLEDSSGTPVDGDVMLNDFVATFMPAAPLDPVETYTAHLQSGITDLAGNALALSSWSFSTPYLAEGTWTPIARSSNIQNRFGHSVVSTGVEMIVWGGRGGVAYLDDGERYDPALDQWTGVSIVGAPAPRRDHTATWTGTEMIIWGGVGASYFNDGGRYDPVTDSWSPMSTSQTLSAPIEHTAVWTGTELIIWGGSGGVEDAGARYDPSTDTWTPVSTINAPSPRRGHHAVFDGQRMIVWGGQSWNGDTYVSVSDGGVYDPAIDVWTPLPSQNAPDITKRMTIPDSVVLAGTDLMVWSPWLDFFPDPVNDSSSASIVSEARRYNSVRNEWQIVVDACESDATSNAVWLNGRMLSWNENFARGYAYDEQRDIWHPITAYPGPRIEPEVIAVGDSVIVWDGRAIPWGVGYRLTL